MDQKIEDLQVLAENDKEQKKKVVVEAISSHCNNSSQFKDLRLIGDALECGDKLEAEVLTGGLTNFSYKVVVAGAPKLQLYAKLAFSHSACDPSTSFDLERTVNEFKMMERFKVIDPDSVAIPYLCIDVDDMKLLVTQWSPADEQWANQFIDGTVDIRIIPKLASSLARLHCIDFEPNFNNSVKETYLSFSPVQEQFMTDLCDLDTKEDSRVSRYAKELGQNTCEYLCAKDKEILSKCECLAHNDAHVFNILVEKKPDINTLEEFGPEGKYVLCDWEMAIPSNIGRDIALTYTFPIACIVAHAINGSKQSSEHILHVLDRLWAEYALALQEFGKKDTNSLCVIYHSIIGQVGSWLFLVYYSIGHQVEFLPFDGNLASTKTARESLGYLGLHFMMLGFGELHANTTIESLQSMFNAAIMEEIEHLLPVKPPRRTMRSSMLRASGRRVSDAAMFSSLTSKVADDCHKVC